MGVTNKRKGKKVDLPAAPRIPNKAEAAAFYEEMSKKPAGYTVGDFIRETIDNWLDGIIKSGQLFTMDIFDLVDTMTVKNKLELFEKIDALSLPELVIDYKLDGPTVFAWLERYVYYRQIWLNSNKQYIPHTTTNEQIALYYYLDKLRMVSLTEIVDAKYQAILLAFLLNRDIENIRNAIRNVAIKENQKKYLTENTLLRIKQLAIEISHPLLKEAVEIDLKKLYKH